ncbi:MAG: hypothetical protein EPN88_03195 [Bacteroidetes bacterium]|nr:MAG: hypothetical protein EPN88_03195 [Bacteroidota bacterium]
MKNILLLLALFLIIIYSCRQIHFVDGESIILNRSIDTSLNDSAMIFGTVYYNDCDQCFAFQAKIWINGTELNTMTGTKGYFKLIIPSGLSTIKCTRINDQYKIIEEIKDLLILKNEKIELKIILGHVVE